MKRLIRNLGLLVIILGVITACQNDEDQVIIPEGVQSSKAAIPFEAIFFAFDPSLVFYDSDEGNYSIHFTATGVSEVEGMNTLELVQSHSEVATGSYSNLNEPNYEFRQGEFHITGEDDNSIYGTYHGYGERYSQYLKAELFLTIEGGTGIYEEATGHLKQKLGRHDNSDSVLKIEMTGDVFVPEKI